MITSNVIKCCPLSSLLPYPLIYRAPCSLIPWSTELLVPLSPDLLSSMFPYPLIYRTTCSLVPWSTELIAPLSPGLLISLLPYPLIYWSPYSLIPWSTDLLAPLSLDLPSSLFPYPLIYWTTCSLIPWSTELIAPLSPDLLSSLLPYSLIHCDPCLFPCIRWVPTFLIPDLLATRAPYALVTPTTCSPHSFTFTIFLLVTLSTPTAYYSFLISRLVQPPSCLPPSLVHLLTVLLSPFCKITREQWAHFSSTNSFFLGGGAESRESNWALI